MKQVSGITNHENPFVFCIHDPDGGKMKSVRFVEGLGSKEGGRERVVMCAGGPREMEEWMEAISLAIVGNPFHEIIKIKKEVLVRDKKRRREMVRAVRVERREVKKSRREVGKGIVVKEGGGEGAVIGLEDIVGIENARSSGPSSDPSSSPSSSSSPHSSSHPSGFSSHPSGFSSRPSSSSLSGSFGTSSNSPLSGSLPGSSSRPLSISSDSLSSMSAPSSSVPFTDFLSSSASSSGPKREKFHPF